MLALDTRIGIAIPCYKRPDLLAHALQAAITACRPLSVGIWLFDDSCSDINLAVIEQAQRLYPHIFHHINEKNLGIDWNINQSINATPTEFVWPLGEDDLLEPQAIEQALAGIAAHPADFYAPNYAYVANDFKRILRPRVIPVESDTLVSGREFYERYAWACGFIGGCIIRKSAWNTVDAKPYLGTYFGHLGVILESTRSGRVGMLAAVHVLNRADDISTTSWSGSTFEVYRGFDEVLAMAGRFHGKPSMRLAFANSRRWLGHGSLKLFMIKRAEGIFTLGVIKKYYHDIPLGFHKLAMTVIACIPVRPMLAMRNLLRKAKHGHKT